MPMTNWLKGVFPALVTPFDENEKIDEEKLRGLVRHLLPHVNGLVACGTTGELNYLTVDEMKRVFEIVVDEVGGQVPVVGGVGAPSTAETIKRMEAARDAGCRAALIISPYYMKPQFNELFDHYLELNKLGFPMILYNFPQCSGVHFKWWSAEGLAYLDNVIGIKDTSGDMPFFMALMEKIRGKISVFVGHDEVALPAMAAGADGMILGTANLIPDIWQKMFAHVKNNEMEEARKLMADCQILVRTLVRNGATQGVKCALEMMGIPAGQNLLPLVPHGPFRREDYYEIQIQLAKLGKLPIKEIEYCVSDTCSEKVSMAVPANMPTRIDDFTMKVGEGFTTPPAYDLAHIDLLIGAKGGPVEGAIERALAEPEENRKGREVKIINEHPRTLLVPTVTIRTQKQKEHLYDHAAKGVVNAINAEIASGYLPEGILDEIVLLANVFVHPSASNLKRIEINNFKAMRHAIRKALTGQPEVHELVREQHAARHPFRYSP